MASLATLFGSGAMTNSIREIEDTDVLFIIGSNTKETHPVIANMMLTARRKGARIIVADPRRVDLCKVADIWLQLKPGSDSVLLNTLAHIIVSEGMVDERFIAERTTGFDAWKKSLEEFTPEQGARMTGIPKDNIVRAARLYGGSRRAAVYYTMGVTQQSQGTANVNAVANLALVTGNIGRPYTGVNPLRGQNNVQGASDAGCLPNVYPGYQRVDIPLIREKFEGAWAVTLSPTAGLMATEVADAAMKGTVKAAYVMGENPLLGEPNTGHTAEGFRKLDFLMVQDIFLTETGSMADVVLPATCFAEKNGTFINTERRVQRVRKAVEPPGQAREDWQIIMELSRRLGYEMHYTSPDEIFEEMGGLWPALEGITYSRLEQGGLQWPCPTRNHPGTEYLYKGGFPRGRVSFSIVTPTLPKDRADRAYPFVLSTGRNLFQYHFGSMSRRAKPIEEHAGSPYIEVHPDDAKGIKVEEGDRVRVSSRRGSITLPVRITERVGRGIVFIPMHYAEAAVNTLTNNQALDTHAKTPEFKISAVAIKRSRRRAE